MVSGELGADLSGPAAAHIVDAQDNGDGNGLVIIMSGTGNNLYPIYQCQTPDIANPVWKRPVGISISLTEGRYVVGDAGTTIGGLQAHFHAAFNNRDIYHSQNGINWTKGADVMPAGVEPNHAIWDADEIQASLFPGVHMIAAENSGGSLGVYKSADGLQTVSAIRPATGFPAWPGTAKAKQISFGPSPGATGSVVTVSEQPSDSSRWVSRKEHSPNWIHEDIPTLLSSSLYNRLRALTSIVWFVFGFDGQTDYASVVPMRSGDGGDTFAEMAAPDSGYKFVDVARAADSRLWGLAIETAVPGNIRAYHSDSGGADGTWTRSTGVPQPQSTHGLVTIACHPLNAKRIYIIGHKNTNDTRTIFTIDRGTTWNTNTEVGSTGTDLGVSADYFVSANDQSNNRLTGLDRLNGSNRAAIKTSDDSGTTWDERWPIGDSFGINAGDFLVGPVRDALGKRMYAAFLNTQEDRVYILESVNGGSNWRRLASTVSGEDLGEEPRGGIAYDPRENALYIKFTGGHTDERNYVIRLAPILSLGNWVDATGDIFPSGVTSLANSGTCQSIAIIP